MPKTIRNGRLMAALLALVMAIGVLPTEVLAAKASQTDWYFLFAVFKNVDAVGNGGSGGKQHAKYTMPQDEVDFVREDAQAFEKYMRSAGMMRAHADVVEIDAAITDLADNNGESWLSPEKAEPLLAGRVDLNKYDHVFCVVSLNDLYTTYLGLTGPAFANGTGHTCINLKNWAYCLEALRSGREDFPSMYVHEFLHFTNQLNGKWGKEYSLHDIRLNFYMPDDDSGKGCYTDIILNRARGNAGTGVDPIVWQYPPHALRTMSELTIPSGVTGIGSWAFGYRGDPGALAKVSIPASVTSIGYSAFYNSGLTDVYYGGTEEQWKAIRIGEFNEALTRANIHCQPSEPADEKPAALTPTRFTDVAAFSPFAEAIQWAVERGITTGKTETTFAPGENCTIGQILTFLWRASGSPAPSGNAGFTDVPADADYARAVAWAVSADVTSGTSAATFSPEEVCTRGQIAAFLYRAFARHRRQTARPGQHRTQDQGMQG